MSSCYEGPDSEGETGVKQSCLQQVLRGSQVFQGDNFCIPGICIEHLIFPIATKTSKFYCLLSSYQFSNLLYCSYPRFNMDVLFSQISMVQVKDKCDIRCIFFRGFFAQILGSDFFAESLAFSMLICCFHIFVSQCFLQNARQNKYFQAHQSHISRLFKVSVTTSNMVIFWACGSSDQM